MSYLIQLEDLEHLWSTFQGTHSKQYGVQHRYYIPFQESITGVLNTQISRNCNLTRDTAKTREGPVPRAAPIPHVFTIDEPSNLFALTIGINNYKNPQYINLKGCVSDAEAVEEYLQSELAVPKSHITSLRDSQATRVSIIRAIEAFMVDSRIKQDSPILIYFAGHGAEVDAPTGWSSEDSKTQMLIPHDCGDEVNGRTIHGIPDRTLGWLLKQLADKKGQNITVVLDNCFSGSGTRILNTETEVSIRGVEYQKMTMPAELLCVPCTRKIDHLPSDLDHQIHSTGSASRGIQVTPGFLRGGFKSHVLLAACGAGELAREVHGRGAFTDALLATLRRWAIERVTYYELLYLMPNLCRQNPQCEGEYQHRPIFGAMAPRRHRITYHSSLKLTTLTIKAGSAHGVTVGSRFSLWKDHPSHLNKDLPLTTVSVTKIHPFSSEATIGDSQISGFSFVAEQVKSGQTPELFIYIPGDECMKMAFEGVLRLMQSPNVNVMNVVVSPPEKANINIVHEPDGFYFIINNLDVNQHGLERLPHSLPLRADAIEFHRVLYAFAHYEYHLRRSNVQRVKLGGVPLVQKVFIEIFKVHKFERTDELISPELEGENLNDIIKGIDVILDDSWYVIKIRNETQLDLYPALFYFDNCDLSVNSLYQSPTAGPNKVDPPLKAGQSLTIGYGGGGGVPYKFDIRGPHTMELGFLKLFLTAQYVDLSGVEQVSPFFKNPRAMTSYSKEPAFWDTITVPVIVRRPSSAARLLDAGFFQAVPANPSSSPDRTPCDVQQSLVGLTEKANLSSPISESNMTCNSRSYSPDLNGLSILDRTALESALLRFQVCDESMEHLHSDIERLSLTQAKAFDELNELDERFQKVDVDMGKFQVSSDEQVSRF